MYLPFAEYSATLPMVSMAECHWGTLSKVSSTTRSESLKAASTSPRSTSMVRAMLFSFSSWISGAPSCMASAASKTAGNSSQSTSMNSSASSAVSRSTAATAATSSPT